MPVDMPATLPRYKVYQLRTGRTGAQEWRVIFDWKLERQTFPNVGAALAHLDSLRSKEREPDSVPVRW
jgi:hypothetical protein